MRQPKKWVRCCSVTGSRTLRLPNGHSTEQLEGRARGPRIRPRLTQNCAFGSNVNVVRASNRINSNVPNYYISMFCAVIEAFGVQKGTFRNGRVWLVVNGLLGMERCHSSFCSLVSLLFTLFFFLSTLRWTAPFSLTLSRVKYFSYIKQPFC